MPDICNICLFTEIELQTLDDPLSTFHDELCDYEVDAHALYCTKCVYLLQKFYNFRDTCKKANTVLKKWMKLSKFSKTPVKELHLKLPSSINISNNNNHAVYSYNINTEEDVDKNIETVTCSTDLCNDDLINLKPGFVILDSTYPPYSKAALIRKENSVKGNQKRIANPKSDLGIDRFSEDIKEEKEVKQKQVNEDKTVVKVEYERLDSDIEDCKVEPNNDDSDTRDSEIIKNCGTKYGDNSIQKILKQALESDSSDNEVLQKKKRKVNSTVKKTVTKTKKVVSRKRKTKHLDSDDSECSEDDTKEKKPRSKMPKFNLTKKNIQRRLGNGDVKDKDGNVIDADIILNNLEIMHSYTYNKIKRYCAGNEPLTTVAINFLARIVKRYGNKYSSIFITKHLTTDEEILEDVKRRETNENYVQSENKCTRCFRYFRFAKMLTYHTKEYHDPNNPYKCKYCDISFSRPKSLRQHLLTHKVVYQCKQCPLATNYTAAMEAHFNMHKGVRYPCTKCEADFKSPPALASHMNAIHKTSHICPCCARFFHSEIGLHTHKLKKHADNINTVGPPSAKCQECNIQFISDDIYQDHRRRSHGDPKTITSINMTKKKKPGSSRRTPKYTCRVCQHVEASMGALMWHFKSEHPNEEFDRQSMALREPHTYLCHECGKGFKDITTYTDHKNVHTGARPYSCTECPKSFHSRALLRNHIGIHLPPTNICPHCGKAFRSSSNLSNHLRQHTGNRRHVCRICGKTFLHQNTLTEHVRGVHLHIRRTKKHAKQHATDY